MTGTNISRKRLYFTQAMNGFNIFTFVLHYLERIVTTITITESSVWSQQEDKKSFLCTEFCLFYILQNF